MDLELRSALRSGNPLDIRTQLRRSGLSPRPTPKQLKVAKIILNTHPDDRETVITALEEFGFSKTQDLYSPQIYGFYILPNTIFCINNPTWLWILNDRGTKEIPYSRVADRLRAWAKTLVIPCDAPCNNTAGGNPIPNCCKELGHDGCHHTWTKNGMSVSW